jgi:hypothetical protein
MEAKLPNINAAFIYWRSTAMKSMNMQDYNGAAGSLNNINALLTIDYKVAVNQSEFNKHQQNKFIYVCGKCKTETLFSDLTITQTRLPFIESVLAGADKVPTWECPKCKKENLQITTHKVTESLSEPNYGKVVGNCPIRGEGIGNRLGFESKFSTWFYKFLEELEYQVGLYRAEYQSQHDESMDSDDTFKDDGKD